MSNGTKYYNQLTPAWEYGFRFAYIEINMNVRREEKKEKYINPYKENTDIVPQTNNTTKINSMETNWLFASLMTCHKYKFNCNNLSASS